MIHPKAIVEPGASIGPGTRVWAFAHILPGARIGGNCNICDHTFIENDVVLGDRVTVKCGVYLWDGIQLQDDVFVGPCVAFTNDKSPRSKHPPAKFASTVVCKGASIGANATILPGLKIGAKAMVGAGAVVTRDVPPFAVVVGNPARITGYIGTSARRPAPVSSPAEATSSIVSGVRVHTLKHVEDMRGDLCVAEWNKDLPFTPARIFFVYNVPNSRVRGEHAHKTCEQFLVSVKGAVSVVVDDSKQREEFVLDKPWVGLHLPARIWGVQYNYTQDAVLMVIASHPYDPDDYLRDYDQFLAFVNSTP